MALVLLTQGLAAPAEDVRVDWSVRLPCQPARRVIWWRPESCRLNIWNDELSVSNRCVSASNTRTDPELASPAADQSTEAE